MPDYTRYNVEISASPEEVERIEGLGRSLNHVFRIAADEFSSSETEDAYYLNGKIIFPFSTCWGLDSGGLERIFATAEILLGREVPPTSLVGWCEDRSRRVVFHWRRRVSMSAPSGCLPPDYPGAYEGFSAAPVHGVAREDVEGYMGVKVPWEPDWVGLDIGKKMIADWRHLSCTYRRLILRVGSHGIFVVKVKPRPSIRGPQ